MAFPALPSQITCCREPYAQFMQYFIITLFIALYVNGFPMCTVFIQLLPFPKVIRLIRRIADMFFLFPPRSIDTRLYIKSFLLAAKQAMVPSSNATQPRFQHETLTLEHLRRERSEFIFSYSIISSSQLPESYPSKSRSDRCLPLVWCRTPIPKPNTAVLAKKFCRTRL